MKISFLFFLLLLLSACTKKEEPSYELEPVQKSNYNINQIKSTPAPASSPSDISLTINSTPWSGSSTNSNLFYAKGIAGLYQDKPHLLLSFEKNFNSSLHKINILVLDFSPQKNTFNQVQVFIYSDQIQPFTNCNLTTTTPKTGLSGTISCQEGDSKSLAGQFKNLTYQTLKQIQ